MRRLEGVIDFWIFREESLKQYSLLFDCLHLLQPPSKPSFDYLRQRGFIVDAETLITHADWEKAYSEDKNSEIIAARDLVDEYVDLAYKGRQGEPEVMSDFRARLGALKIEKQTRILKLFLFVNYRYPSSIWKGPIKSGSSWKWPCNIYALLVR